MGVILQTVEDKLKSHIFSCTSQGDVEQARSNVRKVNFLDQAATNSRVLWYDHRQTPTELSHGMTVMLKLHPLKRRVSEQENQEMALPADNWSQVQVPGAQENQQNVVPAERTVTGVLYPKPLSCLNET